RTEPVAAGDLLVVAVAAPVEVAQAGGKICSCGAHPGMLLDREAAQTPQSAWFDPVSTSGSEMTRYFPARARAASMVSRRGAKPSLCLIRSRVGSSGAASVVARPSPLGASPAWGD